MADTFLRVADLVVATGFRVPDFELATPLNLIHMGREASATTTMLTLAGRMKPKQGEVWLRNAAGEWVGTPRSVAKQVALAGAVDIDGLDRNVSVEVYVREVSAWTKPWYRTTPRDISRIPEWVRAQELFGLDVDPKSHVGQLPPGERFIFRVALGLVARPNPALVVIDDIDQVRSLDLRDELIGRLRGLSDTAPVVVASTNPDLSGQFDTVISLKGSK